MAKKKKYTAKKYYINRELSWLKFNERVMLEGQNESLPLLERLKFMSIFSSNLDEFFMVRVAGLMQQKRAGLRKTDPSGLTPNQQLSKINAYVHKLVKQHSAGTSEIITRLKEHGIFLLKRSDLGLDQKQYLARYFKREIYPALTPLDITRQDSEMLLSGRQLNVIVSLVKNTPDSENEEELSFMAIPVPEIFPRFINIPSDKETYFIPLEEVIADNIEVFVEKESTRAISYFRLTRDADIEVQDDEAGDLLAAIEKAIIDRTRTSPTRLELQQGTDPKIRSWVTNWLNVPTENIYEIDGYLGSEKMMELAFMPGHDDLKIPQWFPQPPRDLIDSENIWQTLTEKDILLFHPYESFQPIVDLIEKAADDPDVMAIKQTLYRTSSDSPIIRALETAAQNGKEVVVLVELKARFDESRNTNWARRLEDAGCYVVYGIAGLKTHSKALLIVRREHSGIKRYCHLATGNYNDKTAKLYTDIGLMTSDDMIASDVASFFNLLTGFSDVVGWSRLTIAPTDLRKKLQDMIDREIKASTSDRPGLIMAKLNSLQDPGIIQSLYKASSSGVKIILNVRGICCLKPGIKGVSDNIEVYSTIDRYLEHPRIFYFANAGHEEIYLSSADWMTRNIDKRLEILFPVNSSKHKRRLKDILKTYFKDNVKSVKLLSSGNYKKVENSAKPLRAQEVFYQNALQAAKTAERKKLKFKPMKNTDK